MAVNQLYSMHIWISVEDNKAWTAFKPDFATLHTNSYEILALNCDIVRYLEEIRWVLKYLSKRPFRTRNGTKLVLLYVCNWKDTSHGFGQTYNNVRSAYCPITISIYSLYVPTTIVLYCQPWATSDAPSLLYASQYLIQTDG